jgi:hypothetical protein
MKVFGLKRRVELNRIKNPCLGTHQRDEFTEP